MLNPKYRSESSDSNSSSRRKGLETDNPVGKRIVEALDGRDLKWLAETTGISDSTLSGYVARGISSAEKAVLIGRVLDRSVEWLITGAQPNEATRLVDAGAADWIDVNEYDLREMTDESMGRQIATSPIRKDWLYATFRSSSDLWLTRLLSDYPPAGLTEDALVVCRTVRREDLAEGHVCLWRVQDSVVVGRFSVLPDATDPRTGAGGDARYLAAYMDPALGAGHPDLFVPPSAIAAGRYHLIGRILGVMMRPL